MSFKQGTVLAIKQDEDKRWILKFERKNPKPPKTKYWFVKLLLGENPPAIGTMWRIPVWSLEKVDKPGAYDFYEELPEKTNPPTVTIETDGTPMEPLARITLDINTTALIAATAYQMAQRATNNNIDEQAQIYIDSIVRLAAKTKKEMT